MRNTVAAAWRSIRRPPPSRAARRQQHERHPGRAGRLAIGRFGVAKEDRLIGPRPRRGQGQIQQIRIGLAELAIRGARHDRRDGGEQRAGFRLRRAVGSGVAGVKIAQPQLHAAVQMRGQLAEVGKGEIGIARQHRDVGPRAVEMQAKLLRQRLQRRGGIKRDPRAGPLGGDAAQGALSCQKDPPRRKIKPEPRKAGGQADRGVAGIVGHDPQPMSEPREQLRHIRQNRVARNQASVQIGQHRRTVGQAVGKNVMQRDGFGHGSAPMARRRRLRKAHGSRNAG
jgi:hypothetical protein